MSSGKKLTNELIAKKLTESLNLGYIRYNLDGSVAVVNSILIKLLGYKSKSDFVSSDYAEKIYRNIKGAIKNESDSPDWSSVDYSLSGKDGALTPVTVHVSKSSEFLEIYIKDLTEIHKLRDAVRMGEDKAKSILDNLVDGIISINDKGIIESVNPAVLNIFGYTTKELVGKNLKKLMPEPARDNHDNYIGNYHRSGKAKIIGIGREVIGRKKDGTTFPIYLGIGEVELSDHKIFIGIIRDITSQKAAEEILIKSQSELEIRVAERTSKLAEINEILKNEIKIREEIQTELEHLALLAKLNPGPVLQSDELGIINIANPAAEGLFDKSIVGKSIALLFKNITESRIKKLLPNEPTFIEEDIGVFSFQLTLIKNSHTNNIFVFGADITDQKKNRLERERLALDLSHRVRELSCLQRVGIAIEKDPSPENLFEEVVEIIPTGMRYPEKSWVRIIFDDDAFVCNQQFIDEEFMISSDIGVTGSIRGVLQVGYNDDTEILTEEVDMCHNISHRLGSVVERIDFRENLLKQEKEEAVRNLAAAVAHEFNQPLQVLKLISALSENEGVKEYSKVKELIPKQVSKISGLVDKLLNVTSYETKVYAAGTEIVDLDSSGRDIPSKKHKVLVVDDDVAILQLMSSVIEKSGFEVDCAATGEEAFELMQKNGYGLVISDVSLPGMSGIELFESVSDQFKNMPFIFMSGYAVEDVHQAVLEKSAGFFPKPFDITTVIKLISGILSH